MAINFPAAAFLAGLKVPNQIMYCISQDNSSAPPVVVYKNVQNPQPVPPWSNHDPGYSQPKEQQQVNGGAVSENQTQSIRVEAGNQVKLKKIKL